MGRLFLSPGQTFGRIDAFDPTLEIIGTNSEETVFLGTIAIGTFDASFNRGGDELIIDGLSSNYDGGLLGSRLIISDDDGTNISIPAGIAGMNITFDDGSYTLQIAGGNIVLGDQVITGTATPLDSLGESNGGGDQAVAQAFAAADAPVTLESSFEVAGESQGTLLYLPPAGDSGVGSFG